MKRSATANWQGSGKTGKGILSTETGILNQTPYSFHSRFEDGKETNPEELIAAAHAGCFSMKLSFNIDGAGFTATELNTQCVITFEAGTVTNSHLILNAKVDGISEEKFAELVKDAEANCPISKLLNTKISVEYSLNA
jgi:osmotically inducible protein OsmC